MHIEEAIQTLLAVRAYTDQPVPDDTIHRILEAGRLTASSMNKQPWHFVVVRERAALGDLAKTTPHGPYIAEASFAVVVAVDHASPYGLSDASRAIQDMMLVAWEHGVGANWVGFIDGLTKVNALLGIPDDLDVVSIVPFGYPAQTIGKGKKQRKPLDEIVHWDRW
ncbi:MAG: nitroreductase family protein [Thermomicrobiales bacterium]